jgi:Carboxymuconolactone decarboxylase family
MHVRANVRRVLLRSIRKIADRYIWTDPSIVATFGCRPGYLAAFKEAWLSLLWGVPERRKLREAVAVAVSTANRCHY